MTTFQQLFIHPLISYQYLNPYSFHTGSSKYETNVVSLPQTPELQKSASHLQNIMKQVRSQISAF